MTDRYAAVWARTAAEPRKVGNLVATDREMRFSYAPEFLEQSGDIAGLSLLLPPLLWRDRPFVHQSTEILPLLPRLMALIPGRNTNNIQRRLYTSLLAKRLNSPAQGFETEWELLMLTGHNGIGHIDVFPNDRVALETYADKDAPKKRVGSRSEFWKFLKEGASQEFSDETIDIMRLIGPTPSVGGQIPKLLVAIPDKNSWDGSLAEPGTRAIDGNPYVDVVMKVEDPQYRGLMALEALCLDLHRELGFEVPRHWRATIDGLSVLAVERFDRAPTGNPIAMESFFSVYATGQQQVRTMTDAEIEGVGVMLLKLAEITNIDPAAARLEVYRRFLMALLTGNGDLHLENLAFLGGPEKLRVSPVFDPTPMRAWDRHDLISALPFYIDADHGLGYSVARVGESFGLTRSSAADILHELITATKDYPERVQALKDVPDVNKKNLATRVKSLRGKLVGAGGK
ncbi:MAG: HipA domain-containing protein [Sulfuricaulis sp.]|uniref:type II toxin-antitoxin system HipA family toxin n=1 Tax=Sulfuricaulis sp. TaxID=2003553 RepID=UPI0025E2910E|nr:HipA domain-containing protein [Sulfuricaulis sp.]MCR4345930.1 HipA domain-containing protein [Sulfuricaulis sp.]